MTSTPFKKTFPRSPLSNMVFDNTQESNVENSDIDNSDVEDSDVEEDDTSESEALGQDLQTSESYMNMPASPGVELSVPQITVTMVDDEPSAGDDCKHTPHINEKWAILNIWDQASTADYGNLRSDQDPTIKLAVTKEAVKIILAALSSQHQHLPDTNVVMSSTQTAADQTSSPKPQHCMISTSTQTSPKIGARLSRMHSSDSLPKTTHRLLRSIVRTPLNATTANAQKRKRDVPDRDPEPSPPLTPNEKRRKLDEASTKLSGLLRLASESAPAQAEQPKTTSGSPSRDTRATHPDDKENVAASKDMDEENSSSSDDSTLKFFRATGPPPLEVAKKKLLERKALQVANEKSRQEEAARMDAITVEEAKKLRDVADKLLAARQRVFQDTLAVVAAKDAELASMDPNLDRPAVPAASSTQVESEAHVSNALSSPTSPGTTTILSSPEPDTATPQQVNSGWGLRSLVGSVSRFVPGFRRAALPETSPVRPQADRARVTSRVTKSRRVKKDRRTIADFSAAERRLIEEEVAKQVRERLENEKRMAEEKTDAAKLEKEKSNVFSQAEQSGGQLSLSTGKKRKMKDASPDVIPNPPGASYGMHPDYFFIDSSSDDDSVIESPTKRPRTDQDTSRRRRVIGNPKQAPPYIGAMFADKSKESPANVFADPKQATTSWTTQEVKSPVKITNLSGTFSVPDASSSEEEDESITPIPAKLDLTKKPLKSCLKKTNEAFSLPTETPQTPRHSLFNDQPTQLERARAEALRHTPTRPSSLRTVSESESPIVSSPEDVDTSSPTRGASKPAVAKPAAAMIEADLEPPKVIEQGIATIYEEPDATVMAAVNAIPEAELPEFTFGLPEAKTDSALPDAIVTELVAAIPEAALPTFDFETPVTTTDFHIPPEIAAALDANWGEEDEKLAWAAWESSFQPTPVVTN